ncbi:MAG: hypothetical protein LC747_06880 [Acidobacteria bacterium]|nr:hypothetical protein [Acidobacteriota bacterium]
MSNDAAQTDAASRQRRDEHTRRVLVLAHSRAGDSLPARLFGTGYEVRATLAEQAAQSLAEFAPHVLLVEAEAGERGEAMLQFAFRLRAERGRLDGRARSHCFCLAGREDAHGRVAGDPRARRRLRLFQIQLAAR